MTDPVIETIEQDLAAAVDRVREANGYNYNLQACVRPAFTRDVVPSHLLPVLMPESMDADEALATAGNAAAGAWRQRWTVDLYVLISDRSAGPIAATLHRVWADVVRAVLADPTRGGHAIDTIAAPPDYWLDGEFLGLTATFDVRYRTDESNPYSER